MARVYLGIDCGTTSVKCMAVDEKGNKLHLASKMHATKSPRDGWMEQDPDGWIEAVLQTVRECVTVLKGARVAAIAFSGHMSSPVFLNEKNKPIYPCMTVGDARCEKQSRWLLEKYEKEFEQKSKNKPLACFVVPKILWFMENEPQKYENTKTFVMAKDYIRYIMTGILNTDITDAGNTLLFDEEKNCWNTNLIEKLGIRKNIFPEVRQSTEYIGKILPDIADACGLNSDVDVFCGGADMACSQIGTGSLEKGVLAVTLSTSGQICMRIHEKSKGYGQVTFHPGVLPQTNYAMGSVFSGGLALNWCYKMLQNCQIMTKDNLEEMNQLACNTEQYPPGSGGVIFLPFLTGSGSPYFDPADRAAFLGISTATDQAAMFKAVMEGVAFHIRENVEVIEEIGGSVKKVYLSGGGIHVRPWVRILTNVMGLKIQILEDADASALGAALIAVTGKQGEKVLQDISSNIIHVVETVEPEVPVVEKYNELYAAYQECYRDIHKFYERLRKAGEDG